jgi:hypothetical protein
MFEFLQHDKQDLWEGPSGLKYLDYPSYLDRLETKLYTDDITFTFTKKRVHTILFSIVVLVIIICLYKLYTYEY